jgi:hypothetical protein
MTAVIIPRGALSPREELARNHPRDNGAAFRLASAADRLRDTRACARMRDF